MSPSAWPRRDRPPEALAPGELHLWRLVLDQPDDAVDRLAAQLPDDEQARAARFRRPVDRRAYVVTRHTLRRLVGAVVDRDPSALALTTGPHGKPQLAHPAAVPLDFNVSHTTELALIGLAREAAVGVDVERIRPGYAVDERARRFFAPEEADAIAAVEPAARADAFFRCWTRKEAVIKACGRGLSMPLDGFVVSLDDQPRLVRADELDCGRTWLFGLEVGCDHHGAAAVVADDPPSLVLANAGF